MVFGSKRRYRKREKLSAHYGVDEIPEVVHGVVELFYDGIARKIVAPGISEKLADTVLAVFAYHDPAAREKGGDEADTVQNVV